MSSVLLRRRGQEISRIIQNTFASVIQTHIFPRTQIDIFIQVLQSDGGTVFIVGKSFV
jgi:exosome complex component RRP41